MRLSTKLMATGAVILAGGAVGGVLSESGSSPSSSTVPRSVSAVPSGPRPLDHPPCRERARATLPDPSCTPGLAALPEPTREQVCRPGYAAARRPPTSYTTPVKREVMRNYGYGGLPLADFELDHLIPLELGGDPRDPRNLWPEPMASAGEKDAVENELHRLVCKGSLPLGVAWSRVAGDWRKATRL